MRDRMYTEAKKRIDNTPELEQYRGLCLWDWHEGAEHWCWIATALVTEIVDWAERARQHNLDELARNLYDGQQTTVQEYENAEAYVADLMQYAKDADALDGLWAPDIKRLTDILTTFAQADFDEAKRLAVYNLSNGLQQTIILNGVPSAARLTPKLARWACRVAFGNNIGGEVWDWKAEIGYRVYAKSARKLYA